MPLLSYWLGYAVAMSSHGLFLGVCGLGLGTGLRSTGPGLTKQFWLHCRVVSRNGLDYRDEILRVDKEFLSRRRAFCRRVINRQPESSADDHRRLCWR